MTQKMITQQNSFQSDEENNNNNNEKKNIIVNNTPPNDHVAVVMVPFPLQGHLNEILHLSCLISSYNIPVHFAGSGSHNRQARLRVHGRTQEALDNIHFHDFEFELPPSASSLPPRPSTGGGGPRSCFPAHLQPVFDSLSLLRGPVFWLLRELSASHRRIVVVHDTLMASVVQDVKRVPNAESFALQSVSAFTVFFHVWESMREKEKPLELDGIDGLDVPSIEGCFTREFSELVAGEYRALDFGSGRLFNTSRAIEGRFLSMLARLPMSSSGRLFALGPLNPVDGGRGRGGTRSRCVGWLDGQERASVVYVSFGTTTTMAEEQVQELARGLERSRQRFIWVLRSADRADVFSGADEAEEEAENRPRAAALRLPGGYEERVKGRGLVVRGWAPQPEILAHPSTGGFVTHCGWNSCLESLAAGVPVAAWPMHSDQPRNAVLLTRVLRVGFHVREWARRDEVVTSGDVERAVARLMRSAEGEEMRERAASLGRRVRASVAEGGSSRSEMDSFVAHITR